MDLKTYEKITAFCRNNLFSIHHGRHLEDCVQYVAMCHFRFKGKQSWKHSIIDYCRENGLVEARAKVCSRAIGLSVSIDAPSKDGEGNQEYLLNKSIIDKSRDESKHLRKEDFLDLILNEINVKQEVIIWTKMNYQYKEIIKFLK